MEYIVQEVKVLQESKKKRSFDEQERDLIFRKLEHARSELDEYENRCIVTAYEMEQKNITQHSELKVKRFINDSNFQRPYGNIRFTANMLIIWSTSWIAIY